MKRIQYLMACAHSAAAMPTIIRPEMLCKYDGPQTVVRVFPAEWRYKCRRCKFTQYYGQNRDLCRTKAREHANTHPHLTLAVMVAYHTTCDPRRYWWADLDADSEPGF